ncbi:MAG: AraC family transcriptional regulator [Gammaproteobacteria bacterium]|jgi:AraC-like DNA-binding protein
MRPAPIPEYTESLRKLLRAYVPNGYPDVRLVSDIMGTSVRTLQRRLAEHGLSHAELVLQTRFEIATELLGDPDIKVVEVPCEVGYSDPSNFIRAFRKIAGMSPDEWRRHQRS